MSEGPSPLDLSPQECYRQAEAEHPGLADAVARRLRYRELMVEHGHLVPADHPDAGPRSLPCGWPPERARTLRDAVTITGI